ncbi:hypothetical protein CCMSSC00406_0009553 [Pleurotus cornucopiae]|uniref:Uncharacterized protein n=1 Tax=Pleurotus cornucopiae TaxID=5321 RepID=A0ACB7IPW1_PLECO|nr:hypothetical protein CCMSSC00406_0009553 [Pleurotus cornucopiae]
MVDSSANKRMQALKRLGCKLLVETRDLMREVQIDDMIDDGDDIRKEIEDGIAFLEKVTNTEIATLRRLQRKRLGEEDNGLVEDDSWDDIADEVQVVLDKIDILWPPTVSDTDKTTGKRLRDTQATDGADEETSTASKPPLKKTKRGGNKSKSKSTRTKTNTQDSGGSRGDGVDRDEDGQNRRLSPIEERAQSNLIRLDGIIRSVTTKPKAGAHALWRRIIDFKNGDHKSEESMAFARLLQGYTKLTTGDLDLWFGDVVRKEGSLKVEIQEHARANETEDSLKRMENWSKSLSSFESKSQVHDLVHNVMSVIVQVQMAEEWGSHEPAWKTEYITGAFEALKDKEIQNAKRLMTEERYEEWFESNRTKFRDIEQKIMTSRNWTLSLYREFGSIVLLDSRWNPSRYNKDHRSEGFGSFLKFFLANMAHRYARGDEATYYPEELQYDMKVPMVKYHYGNEDDNDRTVIETVRFITGDDVVADYVAEFINKRRTKLGKRAVRG